MFFFPVCVWHLNNKIHVFSLAQRNWSRYFSLHARPLYDLPFLQRIQMKHRSKQMLLLLSRKMIIFWFLPLPPSCIISRLIAQNSMGKKHPRRGTKRYRQHHLIRTVVVHHFLKFKFSKWLALRLFFLGKVPSLDPPRVQLWQSGSEPLFSNVGTNRIFYVHSRVIPNKESRKRLLVCTAGLTLRIYTS